MSCHYLESGTRVCCTDRKTTPRTQGVWTTCDHCGHEWWCIPTEYDDLDEPTEFGCSGGCDDGFPADDHPDDEASQR